MFATLLRNSSSAMRPSPRSFEVCWRTLLPSIEQQQQIRSRISFLFQQQQQQQQQQQHNMITMESGISSFHDFEAMNRNGRRPKKANHGRRPVCRAGRRAKTRKWGNPRR